MSPCSAYGAKAAARKSSQPRSSRVKESRVHVVGHPQPPPDLVVDLRQAGDRDAVGDAVLFGEAAGVDQAAGGGGVLEGEAEVDARRRGRLDLGEDVIAVERHDGRAGAGLDVRTGR